MPVALRIVTHVSYVMRTHHDIVAGAAFGEVHVSLFVAGAAFGEIKFMCHFSWQAQHVVKFGMIAGAGNVVIFNGIWSWRVRKVASVARRVAVCVFSVGSWSNRSRIFSDRSRVGNGTAAVFRKFL